jgi:hypothetical protein
MVLATSVTLSVARPSHGGAEILAYTVEARDLDSSIVLTSRHDKKVDMSPFMCQVKDLQSETTYQFRIRAESLVANGEFSLWSDEVELPPLPPHLGGSSSKRRDSSASTGSIASTSTVGSKIDASEPVMKINIAPKSRFQDP